jgi:hypothetical protein
MMSPHKSPGAGSEPALEPVRNDHRVTFTKAGWFHFAYCACGWIDCDPDVGVLSMKAAAHGIGCIAA